MEPVRYLTEEEAFELAATREVSDRIHCNIPTYLSDSNPNQAYGLPRTFKGQELRIIDPSLHHLLPGKA